MILVYYEEISQVLLKKKNNEKCLDQNRFSNAMIYH